MRMSVAKTKPPLTLKQSPNMSKATSIKEALKRWEEKHPDQELSKAKDVSLHFQFPPIEKMDNALSLVHNCEKLSLSTNMIEKIAGLNSFKHLKVLCLSRNYIKNLSGLEGVAETLEQLWVSYNFIEKVKGIQILKNLRVLYLSNNLIKDWSEFNKLQDLPALEDLLFLGNPLQENYDEATWKSEATRRLPNLKKLDGETVVREGSEISV